MRIDLRSLRAERGGRLEVEFRESVASQVDDVPFTEPVQGTLALANLGAVVRVDGHLRTVAHLTCDRCAVTFDHGVHAVIEEEIDWNSAAAPGGAPEDTGAYLLHIGDGVFLDAEALARDALVLALPMVARCSPECRGLCPRCGANLRLEPCGCPVETDERDTIDPRLASLAVWQKGPSSSGAPPGGDAGN
jgi:uncharacterized protein